MEALLRKSCPQCTESSIKTYTVNVRALAKEAGLAEPPSRQVVNEKAPEQDQEQTDQPI